MEKRRLGGNGPQVSAIGIGAMSFAGVYGEATEAEAHRLLDAARDIGIDHIDTSNVYGMGRSEQIIGNYLARQGKAGHGAFRIATKAGIVRDPAKQGGRRFDNSAAHLTAELEGSLARLGVEAVDLFYVHRRDPAVPIEEVAGALGELVRAGKARAIGFSEIAPASLRRAATVHPVAAVQSEYSLWTRLVELGLVQTCAELGTALVAFSPVGRGILSDAPPRAERLGPSDFRRANPRFQSPNLEANLAVADGFRALAAEMGAPTAAVAIAWLLSRHPCVIPIPGTRSVDHLHELAAGAALTPSAADLARIDACLPVGWAHGDRYSEAQWIGPERYC
jgi:aryl-alcohol dehydrogenase-like predicted oxidoreductase